MQIKLKEHNDQLVKLIEKTIEKNVIRASANVDAVHENHNNNVACYHNGRFWDVTEKFLFPKNVLGKCGWIDWLKGFPSIENSPMKKLSQHVLKLCD